MYPLAMWNIRPSTCPCDMNALMEGILSLLGESDYALRVGES